MVKNIGPNAKNTTLRSTRNPPPLFFCFFLMRLYRTPYVAMRRSYPRKSVSSFRRLPSPTPIGIQRPLSRPLARSRSLSLSRSLALALSRFRALSLSLVIHTLTTLASGSAPGRPIRSPLRIGSLGESLGESQQKFTARSQHGRSTQLTGTHSHSTQAHHTARHTGTSHGAARAYL